MSNNDNFKSPWPALAAVYALLLGAAILVGLIGSIGNDTDYSTNAFYMPFIAFFIILALGASGIGLLLKKNFARFLFLVVAPWGSIALGSVFSNVLWKENIPYTVFAIFVYVPLVFLLARSSSLRALNAKNVQWISRGGLIALSCAALMFIARLVVVASGPSGGILALNDYVQRLVLCDVPLWNYVGAFVAVSIPTR